MCLTNAPLNSSLTKRAYEALRLLRAAASWFHSSLESVVEEYYDKLKFAIDGMFSRIYLLFPEYKKNLKLN